MYNSVFINPSIMADYSVITTTRAAHEFILRFALVKRFLKNRQLAKAFIDVYGTQGSIEHTFPDYLSLKNAIEGKYMRLSDDLRYELQFQYNNMTSK